MEASVHSGGRKSLVFFLQLLRYDSKTKNEMPQKEALCQPGNPIPGNLEQPVDTVSPETSSQTLRALNLPILSIPSNMM